MTAWLLLIILSLATFRLTRLITRDDFPPVFWLRQKIVELRPDYVRSKDQQTVHWWLGELVTCLWCASGWVSLALVVTVWALHGLAVPLLWWFAVWAGGSLITSAAD